MKHITVLTVMLCTVFSIALRSQLPQRFQTEVKQLLAKTRVEEGKAPLILFTGSSSIRFWHRLPEAAPELSIVLIAVKPSPAR